MYHGLSYPAVRNLAYGFSVKLKNAKTIKRVPKTWQKNQCASKDWLFGYMRRHPDLALRKPMGTSLGRATAFKPWTFEIAREKVRQMPVEDPDPNYKPLKKRKSSSAK